MKYSMYLDAYVYKSPYPYYIVQADEWLTKFEVWSNRKTFNAWLYSEREVIAMIEAKYPGAERIGRIIRARRAHASPQDLPGQAIDHAKEGGPPLCSRFSSGSAPARSDLKTGF